MFAKRSGGGAAPAPHKKRSLFDRKPKKTGTPKSKALFTNSATPTTAADGARQKNELMLQDLSVDELESRRVAYAELLNDIYEDESLPLRDNLNEHNRWVISRGPLNSQLMIVGEAPGAQEAKQGRPFVGPSGERLDSMLAAQGIDSERHVLVSNLIFVRPNNNRDPSWEEVSAYLPYLRRLITIVRPKLILCMGRLSSALFLKGIGSLTALKGEPYVDGQHRFIGENMDQLYRSLSNISSTAFFEERFVCRVLASYHPAAILRNENAENRQPNPLFAERWSADFAQLTDLLSQSAFKFIDAAEIVRETAEPGFVYSNPEAVRYEKRRALLDEEATAYANNGLEIEVHRVDYDTGSNTFKVIGRSADDLSVCLIVRRPRFSFLVSYRTIKEGIVDGEELRRLQDDTNFALLEGLSEKQKFIQLSSSAGPLVELSLAKERLKYNDISAPKTMLKVELSNDQHKFAVTKILDKLIGERFRDGRPPKQHRRILPKGCEVIKTYERNYKPIQQLLLDKNIYIRGWIQIAASPDSSLQLRYPQQQLTSVDLEYDVNYADLRGYSPNPDEAKNPHWERQAPTRVLALDAEMLAVGGHFPRSEQDPVISIAAYGNTYNRADKKNYTEKIRLATVGKTHEVRSTGRSNYDEATVFCVGSLAELHSSAFKPEYLPNIPPCPKPMTLGWDSGGRKTNVDNKGTTEEGYHLAYAVSIREWNAFVEAYRNWHELVGSHRAARIVKNRHLYELLQDLQVRPGGKGIKQEWKDPAQILKWEQTVQRVTELYAVSVSHKLKHDIANLKNVPEMVGEQPEREAVFGTIQARWHLFRPATKVFSFSNEQDMFRGFYKYINSYDPDIITGYNSNNFDLSYFINRVRVLNLLNDSGDGLISMGRYHSQPDSVETKQSSTAATGDRSYQVPHISGRDCHDLMNYVMREMKLSDYRLASVAQFCLKDTKNDVPYSAIPSLFRTNRERLNRYCGKDAELVVMLMNDMNNMEFLISLARLIGLMHIERLYVDGKQEQVFSVLIRWLREEGFNKVMSDRNKYSHDDDSVPVEVFSGAHVFDPKFKGLYEKLLLCLDYNSLYPSIMQALNLGHDKAGTASRMLKYGHKLEDCFKTTRTFINPKTGLPEYYYFTQPRLLRKEEVQELGFDYKKDCVTRPGKKAFWVFENPTTKLRFRCSEKEIEQRGLRKEDAVYFGARVRNVHILKQDVAAICSALAKMLAARRRVNIRKEAFHPSSEEYRRLNQIQMTLKIVCNSTYGATGVVVGKLASQHISASVTGHGKETILNLASKMESLFDADVQGGDTDSIFVHFPSIDKLSKIYEEIEVLDPVTGELNKTTRIKQILDYANSLVPPPMKIDFEKAFEKIFALAKKRAATLTQTPIWDPLLMEMVFKDAKLEYKGLEMKRRDSCPAAQKILTGFVSRVMTGPGSKVERERAASEFVTGEVDRVLDGQVRFHELIQNRQLSKKTYATQVPHMVLNEKMRKRGFRPKELGERVSFVVVTGRTNRTFSESVEDPDFALERNLLPDYEYVVEKKIQKPIERFTQFMERGEDYNRKMFQGRLKRQKQNLLDDDPILRIVKRCVPCMVCSKPSVHQVCDACRPTANWEQMIAKENGELQKEESAYVDALKVCQACTGVSAGEPIDCDNGSCPSYYPRRAGEFNIVRRKARIDTLRQSVEW